MDAIWYHGTNESSAYNIYKNGVDFSKSRRGLDFGSGFYLTDDFEVAKRRAVSQTKKYNRIYKKNERPSIVSVIIDKSLMQDLKVRTFEYCDTEWLRFVLANRLSREFLDKHINVEHNLDCKYDVVIGSIADSDVSGLASHIEDGNLTFDDVAVYDVLTNQGTTLGLQMSLHTEESLSLIKSKEYEIIEGRKNK